MAKISVDKLQGIIPIPKKFSVEVVKAYDGQPEKIEIDIFPLTVEDKGKMKNMQEKAKGMDKESKEYKELMEELTYELIFDICKKSVDGLTMEVVKTWPTSWFEKIIKLALSHEGITDEQYDSLVKKNQDIV